jgi:WD40 repeat protein
VREWLAPGKVSHAALSPNGDVVAASMEGGAVHFWRQPGREALGSWQGPEEIRALCFTPSGTSVVAADPQGFSVVDVARTERTWRAGVEGALWVFACDGDFVAAGTTDGGLWLWDIARRVLRARLQLSASAVVALDISSARHRLAAADEKNQAAS